MARKNVKKHLEAAEVQAEMESSSRPSAPAVGGDARRSGVEAPLTGIGRALTAVLALFEEERRRGQLSGERETVLANAMTSVRNSHYPRQAKSLWRGIAPGLTVLYGGRATGKSVNAIALQFDAMIEGAYSEYHAVMEPRGLIFSGAAVSSAATADALGATDAKTKQEEMRVAELLSSRQAHIIPTSYSAWLHNQLEAVALRAREGFPPILILDSLTYTIRHLDETKAAIKDSGGKDVTYSGGLSAADILGALHHTLIAEAYGVALIGTVNSELLPIAEVLTGAVEGVLSSRGVGQIVGPSRESGRRHTLVSVSQPAVRAALFTLGDRKSVV